MSRGPLAARETPHDGFESGALEVPDWMSDEALQEWYRIVPQLGKSGLLRLVDRAAVAAYCQAWGEMVQCIRRINQDGPFIEVPVQTSKGESLGTKTVAHPACKGLKEASLRMRSYLSEFGLTPAARARLKTGGITPPTSMQDLLNAEGNANGEVEPE